MSCDCDAQVSKLIPYQQALEYLINEASPIKETEEVTLDKALDRVLAQDIVSSIQVPPFNNSGMDGYAFRLQDYKNSRTLKLEAHIFAGDFYDKTIPSGHCVRIMTGATVPTQLDTVVMQENTTADKNSVTINSQCQLGDNIRLAGEDIDIGDTVLTQGRKLTPADLGLLSSLGSAKIAVLRKIKVAVLSTGDELIQPGNKLKPGQIFESNSVVIKGMLNRLNVNILDMGIIQDDPEAIETALLKANTEADLVITSGGVSVGDADYVKDILDKIGHINFWKVAIKPGKPFAFGTLPDSYFIGLPGNPVSSTVTFDKLAKPFITKLSGSHPTNDIISIPATASQAFKKKPGRLDFQRASLFKHQDGRWMAKPTGYQGSGILSSISQSNGYVILPAESGTLAEGQQVEFYPFDYTLAVFT